MKTVFESAALAAAAFLFATQALANPCPPGNPPTNCAPAPGAILDLHGTAVPHVYTHYHTSFVASLGATNVSFAFREDPAFLFLDDVTVTTGAGPNLLLNGGFESGPVGSNTPLFWSYLNAFGAAAAGVVSTSGPRTGSNAYVDGAVQAYDGITQAIATTVGLTYDIDFWLTDNGGLTNFNRTSTNGNTTDTGGNGIDLLVYAGRIPTLAVPEPAALALVGVALAALCISRRRKTQ